MTIKKLMMDMMKDFVIRRNNSGMRKNIVFLLSTGGEASQINIKFNFTNF